MPTFVLTARHDINRPQIGLHVCRGQEITINVNMLGITPEISLATLVAKAWLSGNSSLMELMCQRLIPPCIAEEHGTLR